MSLDFSSGPEWPTPEQMARFGSAAGAVYRSLTRTEGGPLGHIDDRLVFAIGTLEQADAAVRALYTAPGGGGRTINVESVEDFGAMLQQLLAEVEANPVDEAERKAALARTLEGLRSAARLALLAGAALYDATDAAGFLLLET